LTVSAPVSHVYSDQAVTFRYVVTNTGTDATRNMVLEVGVPDPYFLYHDPSGGTMTGDVLRVTLPGLAMGESVTVEVGLRVRADYKDEDKFTFPATLTYDQGPSVGNQEQAPLVMPTGQFEPGEMFIDVNVVKSGEEAEITLMPFKGGTVRLKVYNSAGELVRTLEAQYPATEKEVMKRKWDGKNEKGEYVASGVYVVYAQMPAVVKTGRLIVLR